MDKFYALVALFGVFSSTCRGTLLIPDDGVLSKVVDLVVPDKDDNVQQLPDCVVQLCKSGIDLACVRDYFEKHSEGSVVNEPKEIVTIKEDLPLYMSIINSIVTTTQTELTLKDEEIEEFYHDTLNKIIVITISFASKGIYCDAPGTIFAIGRPGKEHKVFTEYVNATYPVKITVNISVKDGYITAESLKSALYSAYFPTNNAKIYIGPKFFASVDSLIKNVYEKFIANVPAVLPEIFATKAAYIALAYLQSKISDFGLNPVLYKRDLTAIKNALNANVYDESKFTKPCDKSDDKTKCIQEYFSKQGSCSVISNPSGEPLKRPSYGLAIPSIKSYVILTNAITDGLNGKIKEFYINEETKNLVMEVAFKAIKTASQIADLQIYQDGRRPKEISDTCKETYPVTLTALIPIGDGLSFEALSKTIISTDFTGISTYELGPNFTNSDDPKIKKILKIVKLIPNIIAAEILVREGNQYFQAFVQNRLCDFVARN